MNEKQSLTTSLIVVISGAFVLTYLFPNLQSELALVNGYFPGVSNGQWYRILTVALTHAGWLHLAFNMLALWTIGTPVEQYLGKVRYAVLFISSLVGASLASLYFGPQNIYAVGASGAIYGLFGALFVIGRKSGANYQNISGIILINLLMTFVIPGIDWRAHVGGLITGAFIAYPLTLRRRT